MGVKNLWDILDSCKKTLPLHHLQNKRLCVDLSCWLIQLQTAGRSCPKEKVYLRNLFHRLRALIALNCSLILVTDGSVPSIKLSTYRRRLGLSEQMTQANANSHALTSVSLRRNKGSEFSCMIKEAKLLGTALGIPYLDGVEEAEAQCALLNMESLCDGCFSTDSDILLFGARTVYRDIFLGENGYVICYEMEDIERKLGFGRNSLISLALLLGSDYSQGVHGFGPESACRIVKSLGDNSVLHQIIPEALKRACKGRKTTTKEVSSNMNKENEHCLKQGSCENLVGAESDSKHVEVINAYLKPKCHPPDSESVRRACCKHPFKRTELQQLCEQFFGWSPDQTDLYILPKIAERDLRRFANVRSTSSDLGARIPLHEMPVPCPVSSVIKQRKVQGQDCYEVSWRGFDGIKNSIVPADLIESACPEKVAEFIEKKAEGKKHIRKLRKSNKAALNEVDLQLQGLLLSIESQSNHFLGAANCSSLTNVSTIGAEVIDLCSPSPPLQACKVPKSQKFIDIHVNVINVHDSEDDASPEHEKKARDLRSFIDSIRDDLY